MYRVQWRGGMIYLKWISACWTFIKCDSARIQSPEDNRIRTNKYFNKNGNSSPQQSSSSLWPPSHQMCQYKHYAKRLSVGETQCRFFKSLCKDSWALSLPFKGQCRNHLAELFQVSLWRKRVPLLSFSRLLADDSESSLWGVGHCGLW